MMLKYWKKALIRSGALFTIIIAVIFISAHVATPQPVGCTEEDLIWQSVLPSNTAETSSSGDDKLVYLTFDDGPSKITQSVLDTLKSYDVKATFFVIAASNNEDYMPIIEQIVADGHVIGLHSCTHNYEQIYSSTDAFWQDIDELKIKLQAYGFTDSNLLRFPGGSSNTVSRKYGGSEIMQTLKDQATEKGYTYFDWNVDAQDAIGSTKSAESIYNQVVKQASEHKVCVVLMHDTIKTEGTAKALPQIIEWFINAGYRFDTLDNKV